MQSFQTPEPARVLASMAILLVLIDFFAWKVNTYIGVVVLPFAFFAVMLAVFRMSAPWYIKKKALSYIQNHSGRVHIDDLVRYLTPIGKHELETEKNREVIVEYLRHLDETRVIQVLDDGAVIKAGWGGRVR
ncbi:hypothetical protein SAMN02745216_05246 [Desulfatibacillum alkenivorans DSM 16219]|uniref:Uncharacterized protein n=1 Tax=Desulfatibacillum alkenivorans DSM 16219 TaxID=1121393 RepID=A0A1M7AY53_9BACT|nr:hypothetical protein [Desulfatibacillum alkenivorans]SHL47641.1 hypothetical protein SAMN02745216_05246 [Desulfatibacillum alkenivorans DSM 16219]